ncbi:HEXXH motif-containing putative peptide modification protein [Streptomyces sp. NPDC093109]|uniref:aKG-HExxH-type peptide beta-hydroxylase n=1 Tax=Streptomyces sp. NPDC093109 TaxID=3154977 RepID=UPI00344FE1BF
MSDLSAVLDLEAITTYRAARIRAIHDVLQPGASGATPPPSYDALDYALAHHLLEGAETAARDASASALHWHRTGPSRDWSALTTPTALGPRIILAPPPDRMIRSLRSETPYYVLGPNTPRADAALEDLAATAFAHTATAGLGTLTGSHAPVVVLTGRRRPDQILRNFTITSLPGTVFTDHTGDPVALGREIVHEAAHNWLNDAFTALKITIPDDAMFHSPWRATNRPAFGFLHACFAFPLTAIYAARALPNASGNTRTVLTDHLRQQREHLTRTGRDFDRALRLIDNEDLRARLNAVYRAAPLTRLR